MCLFSTKKEPYIADEDIVCYKVLDIEGHYITPIQEKEVEVPSTMTAIGTTTDMEYDDRRQAFMVGAEGVHAYQTFDKALRYKEAILSDVIVRCIIPKGTEYWLGDSNDIAAKTMELKEIVYPQSLKTKEQ